MSRIAVVVPNLNGEDNLRGCLDSLISQTVSAHIMVVDNGSVDNSLSVLKKYPEIEVIEQPCNLGFAGGVNVGFKKALSDGFNYLATLNNDAVADKNWIRELAKILDRDNGVGIVTSKVLTTDGEKIDSTGDYYTVWGLPYPRGRGETAINKYDTLIEVFGASGGASIYRASMLHRIGLFDENFFAYYEDMDLSFRAQLAGWKVRYEPKAVAYHQIGATSSKMSGFTTYQTVKNLPQLFFKNVPRRYLFKIGWRFYIAYSLMVIRAITRGQIWPVIKGCLKVAYLSISVLRKRIHIQRSKQVSDKYIWEMLAHDLPPNAYALRTLRAKWWHIRGKKA